MKWLFQLGILLVALVWCIPARAWTNQISNTNSGSTCTSGSSCTVSVTPTSGWLVVVMGENDNTLSLSSCCGGAGCTWTSDVNAINGVHRVIVQHSTNCGGSVSIGPTWSAGCSAGPACFTDIVAWSTATSFTGLDGTAASCTTTTAWCTPSGLTSANDVIVGIIGTAGTVTACTGGSGATCMTPQNGNDAGYITNPLAGTSYSAPTWTGSSGTSQQGVVAYAEAASGGNTTVWFKLPTVGPSWAISLLLGILLGAAGYGIPKVRAGSMAGNLSGTHQPLLAGPVIEAVPGPDGVYQTVHVYSKLTSPESLAQREGIEP